MKQNNSGFTIALIGTILFFVTVIVLHSMRTGEQVRGPAVYDSDILVSGHSARMAPAPRPSHGTASAVAFDVRSDYTSHTNRPRE